MKNEKVQKHVVSSRVKIEFGSGNHTGIGGGIYIGRAQEEVIINDVIVTNMCFVNGFNEAVIRIINESDDSSKKLIIKDLQNRIVKYDDSNNSMCLIMITDLIRKDSDFQFQRIFSADYKSKLHISEYSQLIGGLDKLIKSFYVPLLRYESEFNLDEELIGVSLREYLMCIDNIIIDRIQSFSFHMLDENSVYYNEESMGKSNHQELPLHESLSEVLRLLGECIQRYTNEMQSIIALRRDAKIPGLGDNKGA